MLKTILPSFSRAVKNNSVVRILVLAELSAQLMPQVLQCLLREHKAPERFFLCISQCSSEFGFSRKQKAQLSLG